MEINIVVYECIFYEVVFRVFLFYVFLVFDIWLILVIFIRYKLRFKWFFVMCVCLLFGLKLINYLLEGLFFDMFNDEIKGVFVCCFKYVICY